MKYAIVHLRGCHLLRRIDGSGGLESNSHRDGARNLVRVLPGPPTIGYQQSTFDVAVGHGFKSVFHATQLASGPVQSYSRVLDKPPRHI